MLSVAINELANVLTLVRALLNDVAVVLEQMVDEKFVEVSCRGVMVFINLSRQGLTEDQGVHEASCDRLELSQQHQKIGVKNCKFVGTLIQGLNNQIDLTENIMI